MPGISIGKLSFLFSCMSHVEFVQDADARRNESEDGPAPAPPARGIFPTFCQTPVQN